MKEPELLDIAASRSPGRLGSIAALKPSRKEPQATRIFEYRARRSDGQVVTGREVARDELELDRRLEREGLLLTACQPVQRGGRARAAKLSRQDLFAFTSQLGTVLSAGIPIVQGLREMHRRARGTVARASIQAILEDLQAGESLSSALEQQPRSFPSVFRSAVRAGEQSTQLPEVLKSQAAHLAWVREIRGMATQALVYPAVLAVAILGLILILVTFLVPRLTRLYPGGVEDLPEQTRFVMALASGAEAHWKLLCLGLLGAAGLGVMALRQPVVAAALARLLSGIPRLGVLMRQLAMSRFAKTSALLHSAGVEVVTTLELAGEASGNPYYQAAFKRATERVQRGSTLADALDKEPCMDPFLVQLVGIGEASGDLSGSLHHLVESYEAEIPRTVKYALSLIEPGILVLGGGVVLYVLLAALLPIVTLYEKL
jgi:type II secretory pathway component PulF